MTTLRSWRILLRRVGCVAVVAVAASLSYAAWEYNAWRNQYIEWDRETIHRLCGGETAEDRLLDIQFVKEWEYKALKPTADGKNVWIHWRLTKRHCGNWMLVDPSQRSLIRPVELRFPNGLPPRQGYSCLGLPTSGF